MRFLKFLFMIFLFFATTILCIGIMWFTENVLVAPFLPKDTLFYETPKIVGVIKLLIILLPIQVVYDFFHDQLLKKHLLKLSLLWGCCVIFLSFIFVSVQKETITFHYPFFSHKYKYDDVKSIEARYAREFELHYPMTEQGQFLYKIYFNNQSHTFIQPNVIQSQYDNYDTYLELEVFDKQLVEKGIYKTSSDENYDKRQYDKKYIDRFLRIVRNYNK